MWAGFARHRYINEKKKNYLQVKIKDLKSLYSKDVKYKKFLEVSYVICKKKFYVVQIFNLKVQYRKLI